jgi:hypothetical protein
VTGAIAHVVGGVAALLVGFGASALGLTFIGNWGDRGTRLAEVTPGFLRMGDMRTRRLTLGGMYLIGGVLFVFVGIVALVV